MNKIYVRLPKPWLLGEEINLEKLAKFTKELCKEVKRAVDEGRIGDGKDKLDVEKLFEGLTKSKTPSANKPKNPRPDRVPSRP